MNLPLDGNEAETQQLFGLKGSLKTFCISLTIFQFNKVKRFSWCDTFNNLFSKENYCIIFWSFMQFCLLLGNCVTLNPIVFTFLINLHISWFTHTILRRVCIIHNCQLQMQSWDNFCWKFECDLEWYFYSNSWKTVGENLRIFSNEP